MAFHIYLSIYLSVEELHWFVLKGKEEVWRLVKKRAFFSILSGLKYQERETKCGGHCHWSYVFDLHSSLVWIFPKSPQVGGKLTFHLWNMFQSALLTFSSKTFSSFGAYTGWRNRKPSTKVQITAAMKKMLMVK